MKSKKSDNEKLAIERGKRLRNVINKHFGNQRRFANAVNLTANTINDYVQGRRIITNDYALKLELRAGISSEYLLEGTGEMLNPKFSIHKLPTYLLTVAGISETVLEIENIDLYKFFTNDLKKPILVMVTSPQFCKENNIKLNSILIIDKDNFNDGDKVLATVDGKFTLMEYTENSDKSNIIGAAVYKIEMFQ